MKASIKHENVLVLTPETEEDRVFLADHGGEFRRRMVAVAAYGESVLWVEYCGIAALPKKPYEAPAVVVHRVMPKGRPFGQQIAPEVYEGLKGSMTVDFAKTYMSPHALVIDFDVHQEAMRLVNTRYNARIKDLEARHQHIVDIATGRI